MEEILPELICIGVDVLICSGLYLGMKWTEDFIKDLKSAPILTIDEHIDKKIESHPLCTFDEKTKSKKLPYAVIRGDVTPLKGALSSNYAENLVGLIQNVSFHEHKRNLNKKAQWVDSQNTIASYSNESPFCLTNSEKFHYFVLEEPWKSQLDTWSKSLVTHWDSISALKRPHVEIRNWRSATIDLDRVYDEFEPAGVGILGKHMLGAVAGDIHKGVQTVESMLLKGTTLTGIGEIVSDQKGIRLQAPSNGNSYYLIKGSLSSLIRSQESNKHTISIILKVCVGIGVILSGVALWKLQKKSKTNTQDAPSCDETSESEVAETPTVGRSDNTDDNQSVQCVVCEAADREVTSK